MSPTVDEGATRDDPRVRRDHHAAQLFTVLARAIEFDGLPAPYSVSLSGRGTTLLQFDFDATADVEDWAQRLGATAALGSTLLGSPPWRRYSAGGSLEGMAIEVWAPLYEGGEPA